MVVQVSKTIEKITIKKNRILKNVGVDAAAADSLRKRDCSNPRTCGKKIYILTLNTGKMMNRFLKSLMLSGLMATLVIATGCQNKKPQFADEEVTEQEAMGADVRTRADDRARSDDRNRSDDRDRSDNSGCQSDDDNN